MHPELHVWKCRFFSVYDKCLIVAVICDTILPYNILQRYDIGNCILVVPCFIILSRHTSLVLDGECYSVSLDSDLLV